MFSRLADGLTKDRNAFLWTTATPSSDEKERERNACGLDETHSLINMPNQTQYPKAAIRLGRLQSSPAWIHYLYSLEIYLSPLGGGEEEVKLGSWLGDYYAIDLGLKTTR